MIDNSFRQRSGTTPRVQPKSHAIQGERNGHGRWEGVGMRQPPQKTVTSTHLVDSSCRAPPARMACCSNAVMEFSSVPKMFVIADSTLNRRKLDLMRSADVPSQVARTG